MANDNNLPALVEVTDVAVFKDWSFEDTSKWLTEVAGQFGKVRLTVGLGLWVLRDRGTEEDYGVEVRKLADLMEVDERTLRRWRAKAQSHFILGPPAGAKARSEGQTNAQSGTQSGSDTASEPDGDAPEPEPNRPNQPIDTTATEQPNADQQPTGDTGSTGPPVPLVDRPEQLSLFDDLFAHKPTEVATAIPSAEGLAVARKLRKWVDDFESAVKGVAPAGARSQKDPTSAPDGATADIGEAATTFLRLLKAMPADSHSVKVWEQFNRDLASKSFAIINAKTKALKK